MGVTAKLARDRYQVREPCAVEIVARSTKELRPGDAVEVQYPHTWSLVSGPSFTREFQAADPEAEHYVAVGAEGARFEMAIRERHLYRPQAPARHGRHMVATLAEGAVPAGAPVRIVYANTYAPYVAEAERIWMRVAGVEPDEPPVLTVTPGAAESMRIIVPSGVEPGAEFHVLVVSLDRFENRSRTGYADRTLTRSDGEVVAQGLSFTGSVRLSTRIEKEGVFRFRLGDVVSNAVRVGKGLRGPYWGDIHIHTKVSGDGQGTDPYDYARDVSGLDFAGCADHCESMGELGYAQILKWANDACEPGRFVTVLADERNPRPLTGHHNIYFCDEESFLAHAAKGDYRPPADRAEAEKWMGTLDPSKVMLIPHHTGIAWRKKPAEGVGAAVDMDAVDDLGLRPVMEVYSHHGQSETYAPQHVLAYEFNRMRNPERRGNVSVHGPYYAQAYWMAGRRFGVIGSSDEHSGQGGRRHGGLAAVFAEELTRGGVFDALRERRCYATTGERILLEFSVGGVGMGQSGTRKKNERLAVALKVWGTRLLLRVEVLRCVPGRDGSFVPIMSDGPRPESMDFECELEDELSGDSVYYARVTQEPLEWPAMAWTSPVWIDVR